ncbi:MAG: hypothetical protein US62_C0049G0002 [Candidatus Woesebacteria bacterium GW2011_GWA1_37_8]|uniref:Uncharacterized protein n=1 Tax=Candidatus Woesebacteria bacterium GW2011_GWA1_37_8 TaxID=1618546 RepID=A0A0G0K2Z2_9BACT|nr:MAG: hypothetical protein US39_C0001G0072 [Microgenomates group bacterium GW2011_GWC1_37_12b]KKQ43464.1 MAG: hypothetical protein US62_C0049G0002 [Candidatus Woesebacteria bacterium GW2011_GWA1_37_8]
MDSENSNKLFGYLLLVVGLLVIVFCAFKVYRVFTGQEMPFNLFTLSSVSVDLGKVVGQPTSADLKQELFGADLINKPLNYGFYLMLMGFIASVGFKIASLGVQLARTIKVNVKEKIV